MSFERELTKARGAAGDPSAMEELARAALAQGEEERALPLVRQAAEAAANARLWQWAGLLERSLDEHEPALWSFAKAADLDPADASIAHGRARVALEAGVSSLELFEAALRLAPGDGELLLGYAAAMFAAGKGEHAEALLDRALAGSPFWAQGHIQLAQLRAMLGKRGLATASVERAITSNPRSGPLWTNLFDILLRAQDFDQLDEAVNRARAAAAAEPTLPLYEAIAASELRDVDRADRLFDLISADDGSSIEIWRIRHLLRTGRIADAVDAVDRELATDRSALAWPYASVAWRLARDSRWQWLEDDLDRLVSVIDLSSELGDIAGLERTLRGLHHAKGEYLDQSVRGGSQTDGPLFTRIDPQIRSLRSAIVRAVERHVRDLSAPDPNHPLLSHRRDRRVRFSGSWSVLLRGGGHHANHVHPQGWISSALYVALPSDPGEAADRAGWLSLGEPQTELGVDLPPVRYVEPQVGRLVLFPSTMWHGTVPFEEGERMSVAFDVRRPS